MKKSRSNHDSSRPPSRPSQQRNTTSRREPARRDPPPPRSKQNYDSSYDRRSGAGSNGSRYRDSYNDRYNDRYSDRNYDGYGSDYRRDPYGQEPPRRRSSSGSNSSSRSRKSQSRRRRFPVSTVILLLLVVVLLVVLMKACISDSLGSNYKMNLDPQSIRVGETSQATVTGTVEGDKIQFTSADTSIASVDNSTGVVKANKLGTTTIAVLVNGKSVGSSTLSVVDDGSDGSPVTISSPTLSLAAGDTFTLNVNVQSDEPPLVQWSSNNETVATVSGNGTQGTVKAVSSGEAIITATVGTKFATCTVTVKAAGDVADPGGNAVTDPNADPNVDPNAITPNGNTDNTNSPNTGTGGSDSNPSEEGNGNAATPTGIKLSDSAYTLKIGGTLQLEATITPEEAASLEVTWTTSDKSIATVSNGVVLARAPGSAEITAKVGDLEAVCKIQVKDEA